MRTRRQSITALPLAEFRQDSSLARVASRQACCVSEAARVLLSAVMVPPLENLTASGFSCVWHSVLRQRHDVAGPPLSRMLRHHLVASACLNYVRKGETSACHSSRGAISWTASCGSRGGAHRITNEPSDTTARLQTMQWRRCWISRPAGRPSSRRILLRAAAPVPIKHRDKLRATVASKAPSGNSLERIPRLLCGAPPSTGSSPPCANSGAARFSQAVSPALRPMR